MTQKVTSVDHEPVFGTWIKRRRKDLDLTQAELAHDVGCAVSTLRKIEAGQLRPSKEIAARLIDRLGANPEAKSTLLRQARFVAPSMPEAPIPAPMPDRGRSSFRLPTPPTSMIGRKDRKS